MSRMRIGPVMTHTGDKLVNDGIDPVADFEHNELVTQ